MNKTEKQKVKKAIQLLMTDDGFEEAIDILSSLVGMERSITHAMKQPYEEVSIFGIVGRSKTNYTKEEE